MNKTLRYFLIALGFCFFAFLIWYFASIVTYLLISAILSLIGTPLVRILCKLRVKNHYLPRSLGAAFTLLLLLAIIFAFFGLFIPTLAKEAKEFSKIDIRSIIENLNIPAKKVLNFLGQDKDFNFNDYVADKAITMLDITQISNYVTNLASVLGDIFIAIFSISFITFFFLKEQGLFGKMIILLVPQKFSDEAQHIVASCTYLLKRYFIGIFIDIIAVGTLVGIGLCLIGMKPSHAVLIACFAGIVNVIPYVGPLIGSSFGMIIGLATHLNMKLYPDLTTFIGLIALVFVVVHIIDNAFFQPMIYSNSVNAHPLEIFLVLLVAGNLAGIIGMLLAIPTYTVLRVIAKEFFYNARIVRTLTSKMDG